MHYALKNKGIALLAIAIHSSSLNGNTLKVFFQNERWKYFTSWTPLKMAKKIVQR
jgi:hypothetical protein